MSDDTEAVTLTIGGNDVGFKEFATECLHPIIGECDEFTDIYDETMNAVANLQPDIEDALEAILGAAPNATIYVVGYPHIAPYHEYVYSEDLDCTALFQPFPNAWGNGRAARDVVDGLNSKLEASVNAVSTAMNTAQLVFVDTSLGAFYGHDTCADDGQGYFNGIDYLDLEHTAHPNADGHQAFKEDIAGVLD